MSTSQEIQTRAAFEAACIQFVEHLIECDTIKFVYAIEAEYVMRYFEPDSAGEVLTSSEMIEYIRSQHRDLQLIPIAIGKALTDLSLIAAQQTEMVSSQDLDTSLCLIRHFRDLQPLQQFYERK